MKLLLDTHIWLWSLLEPDRLKPGVYKELASPDNELWVSPISTWEAIILMEKGRLRTTGTPHRMATTLLRSGPFHEAPLTHDVAVRSRKIKLSHEDPADHFIAATAQVYDLTLVTADKRLRQIAKTKIMRC